MHDIGTLASTLVGEMPPLLKGGARSAGGFVAAAQVHESCGARFSSDCSALPPLTAESWLLSCRGVWQYVLTLSDNRPCRAFFRREKVSIRPREIRTPACLNSATDVRTAHATPIVSQCYGLDLATRSLVLNLILDGKRDCGREGGVARRAIGFGFHRVSTINLGREIPVAHKGRAGRLGHSVRTGWRGSVSM
jgi:hypothetical protein